MYRLSLVLAVLALAPGVVVGDEIRVSKKDCQRITPHVPAADVEYKPGVDARGRKVAPAELPGSAQVKLPDEIRIDIGIDLAAKYGLGSGGAYTGKATLGQVTVKGRRAYFDGQPLDDAEQNAIAQACAKAYGRRR